MENEKQESPYERVMRKSREEKEKWAIEVEEPAIKANFGLIKINQRRWGIIKRSSISSMYSNGNLYPIAQYTIMEDQHTYQSAIDRIIELNSY